jgi:3-deoxy-D-manno-octulosonic-acid transferase
MPDSGTAIYLVDTLGELGLFYRLAGIVFVGGSLTPVGGHNPLEPALLDCAVLHGPDMTNCAAIARELEAAGGAVAVDNAEDLASEVGRLLDDPGSRARQAGAAAAIAARHRGVLDAVLGEMAPWLDRIAPIRAHAVA